MRFAGLTALGLLLCLVLLPLVLWANSPIDARAWAPRPAIEVPENDVLTRVGLLGQGLISGPEDVQPVRNKDRPDWLVYAGQSNGDIVRIGEEDKIEVLVNTGGHPLGLALDARGRLVIADAEQGLLRLDLDKLELKTLVPAGGDFAINFVDDVDIANDGVIYFSDASAGASMHDLELEALEARPHGRLFAYNPRAPEDKRLRLLLDDLYFANGVALAPDQQSVLVNETFRYRIKRYWLAGPKAGTSEVFASALPGFPDGISRGQDGRYWVALYAPRDAMLDRMHPHPAAKEMVASLPKFLQPAAVRHGGILVLDENGQVIAAMQDPKGERVWEITSVEEAADGQVYLGTLHGDRIGVLSVKDLELP